MSEDALLYTIADLQRDTGLLGIQLSDRQAGQFIRYAELLREWNEHINLTAIVSMDEVLIKHFLDSAHFLVCAHPMPEHGRVLDVGTGAGLPGLAVKIAAPGVSMVLCDALRKRVDFLREVVRELGLQGIEVIHARAEELARSPGYRDGFTFVTARAVSRLRVLVEWCLPFVQPSGRLYAFKGPSPAEEMDEASGALRALKGRLVNLYEYGLPHGVGGRSIIVVEKTGATPPQFPRKPGDASRSPM